MIYICTYLIISIPFLFRLKENRFTISCQIIFIYLFISFAYKTGGDSFIYMEKFSENFSDIGMGFFLNQIFLLFEIFHLDYLSFRFFVTFIFMVGILNFIKDFKNLHFYIILMFPIVFLVYSMGYLKQGLALTVFLNFLTTKGKFRYFLLITAPLIHNSAIVLLILYGCVFFYTNKLITNKLKILFLSLVLIFFLIFLFNYYQNFLIYYKNYINNSLISSGSILRSTILLLFAIIFLSIKNLFLMNSRNKQSDEIFVFFSILSWIVIILYPLCFFFSTPIDRVFIYFSPLQFYTIFMLLEIIKNNKIKFFIMNSLILFYFIYLNMWVLFSSNFRFWENYQIIF